MLILIQLWFDVGIKRYTTYTTAKQAYDKLWFDVGIKRYTTQQMKYYLVQKLWFDVGIKRYTTTRSEINPIIGCGLM